MKRILLLIPLLAFGLISEAATPASGLNAKEFDKYWKVESEGPYTMTFHGDTAEFIAPKGLSVWRKEKMEGRTVIEYTVRFASSPTILTR